MAASVNVNMLKKKIMFLSIIKGVTKLKAKVIFVSTTKIGENTTNISKLLFFTLNLHFVISNQISTYRKLNLPLTSSIYFIFLPLEMQNKTQTDQSMPCFFLLCLKRSDPQTFKSGSCKKSFLQCAYDWCNLLR